MIRVKVTVLFLCMLCSVISCNGLFGNSQRGDIKAGSWSADGTVYTNEWSKLRFTMPAEGFVATPQEDIDAWTREGLESIGGNADLTMRSIVYDYLIYEESTGVPHIQLAYQNLGLDPATRNMDMNDFIEAMESEFEVLESQGLTNREVGRETETIAGVDWTVIRYIQNGTYNADYYLYLEDGYMWGLNILYTDDTANQARELLAGVTAVE